MKMIETRTFGELEGDAETRIGESGLSPQNAEKRANAIDLDIHEDPFFDLSALTDSIDLLGNILETSE
jgi:hypothetical protein